ncbi:MAG: NADH-quinone oxidoreductase subunit, partial [Nocardioidaceae bacterium]|nr:NADH-quinone oxidoreductase subunit [Nocardioidaceae bacterium]
MVETTRASGYDPYAAGTGGEANRYVTVTGQDWDDVVAGIATEAEERVVVNMGPQHPSTHGVLRLILELDG